jgi:hypothetical protein
VSEIPLRFARRQPIDHVPWGITFEAAAVSADKVNWLSAENQHEPLLV